MTTGFPVRKKPTPNLNTACTTHAGIRGHYPRCECSISHHYFKSGTGGVLTMNSSMEEWLAFVSQKLLILVRLQTPHKKIIIIGGNRYQSQHLTAARIQSHGYSPCGALQFRHFFLQQLTQFLLYFIIECQQQTIAGHRGLLGDYAPLFAQRIDFYQLCSISTTQCRLVYELHPRLTNIIGQYVSFWLFLMIFNLINLTNVS